MPKTDRELHLERVVRVYFARRNVGGPGNFYRTMLNVAVKELRDERGDA